MYNVIEEINKCRIICIEKSTDDELQDENLNGSEIDLYGNKFSFPAPVNNRSYNNITVTKPNLTLIILQDYGQGDLNPIPEEYSYIPAFLVPIYFSGSIGWCNGYLSIITRNGDILHVIQLQKIPQIEIEKLNAKRPFSYELCSKGNKVFVAVLLNYLENTQRYLIDLDIDKTEILDPVYIEWAVSVSMEAQEDYTVERQNGRTFISRDWLVANGWKFDGKAWYKNSQKIVDDCDIQPAFTYNSKEIFYIDEISDKQEKEV